MSNVHVFSSYNLLPCLFGKIISSFFLNWINSSTAPNHEHNLAGLGLWSSKVRCWTLRHYRQKLYELIDCFLCTFNAVLLPFMLHTINLVKQKSTPFVSRSHIYMNRAWKNFKNGFFTLPPPSLSFRKSRVLIWNLHHLEKPTYLFHIVDKSGRCNLQFVLLLLTSNIFKDGWTETSESHGWIPFSILVHF